MQLGHSESPNPTLSQLSELELAAPREELPKSTKKLWSCVPGHKGAGQLSERSRTACGGAGWHFCFTQCSRALFSLLPSRPRLTRSRHTASSVFKIVMVLMFQRFLLKKKRTEEMSDSTNCKQFLLNKKIKFSFEAELVALNPPPQEELAPNKV